MTARRALYAVCGALCCVLAMPLPAGPTIDACVDFGCGKLQQVTLDASSWQAIAALFDGVDSPASERAAIAQAIARFETEVGRHTETWQDLAENWRRAGEPGELDCIAESTNTDRYLRLLDRAGLLRWHRVTEREMRGWLLVHWTAVLQTVDKGEQWAVDSWFRDNGQPPVIIPLAQWYHYSGPDN